MSATLESAIRKERGSNQSKQLRKKGIIPGTVYGLKQEPLSVSVDEKLLEKLFKNDYGTNIVFDLVINNDGKEIKEKVISYVIERNAISRRIISIDFLRVDDKKTIKSSVPVNLCGNSPGLKMGGVMMHNIREVSIESLPQNIPTSVDIDVSTVSLGEFIRIKDIASNYADFKILTSEMEVVLKVAVPRAAAVEETAEEGEAEEGASEEAKTDAAN
jgi:large subunit ribosomal protein L25